MICSAKQTARPVHLILETNDSIVVQFLKNDSYEQVLFNKSYTYSTTSVNLFDETDDVCISSF